MVRMWGAVAAILGLASEALADSASNTITVRGAAFVRVAPDTATIDLGVVAVRPTAAAALAAESAQMTHVIAAIRAAGVPDKAIQTSQFAIEAQHPVGRNGAPDETRISGFEAVNKLTVTIMDMRKIADVIDAAVKAGANASDSIAFDLKNRAVAEDQALTQAIRNARHKAEIMAAAEHTKLGNMVSMSQGVMADAPTAFADFGGLARTSIEPGEITIGEQVSVVYSLR